MGLTDPTAAMIRHLNPHQLGHEAGAILQAIDAAGYELRAKQAGTPAPVLQTVPCARYRVEGMKGAYLLAIDVPGKGSLVCVETMGWDGKAERSPWVWAESEASSPQSSHQAAEPG